MPKCQAKSVNVGVSSSRGYPLMTSSTGGTIHREIFTFPRAIGSAKDQEWEDIVFPVIKTWGTFVEKYL